MTKQRLSAPAAVVITAIVAGVVLLGAWHVTSARNVNAADVLFFVMFVSLAITILMSVSHRNALPKDPVGWLTGTRSVGVAVPAYNEDPALLVAGLESIAAQSHLPSVVIVVDDGSMVSIANDPEVQRVIRYMGSIGIFATVLTQANAGKRHAQARAFQYETGIEVDTWVTVDSDTVLHKNAIANLIVPFQDETVMSVAGIAYGINHKRSLLTRVIELGYVMSFINGRASEAWAGAVRVNCGVIAAYRSEVITQNISRYLGQTFLGEKCLSGDDRALTIFAREMGRTEFQSTAIAYSAHPAKFSHLVRQRLRWAKSWYWGTWWLLSRPVSKVEFWITVAQVFGMISYLVVMLAIVGLIFAGLVSPLVVPGMVLFSTVIMMASSFRYVTHGREDVSVWDRLLTWMTAPISTVLFMFVLNPLYWVAAFQLKKMGWGTRTAGVEVTA